MAHQSKYRVINESKYKGNLDDVNCRSSWERALCKYFDNSTSIKSWSSEPFSVKYVKPTTGRLHRYFPDFLIELNNGKKILIEVKPLHETKKPIRKKRQREKTYARARMTFEINKSKWKAAEVFCKRNQLEFQIWTQEHIKALGVKIVS